MVIDQITSEEISEVYSFLISSEISLLSDPTQDGEYQALLYIQESLAAIAALTEKITVYQARINHTSSLLGRDLTNLKLIQKVLKKPADYSQDRVKELENEYNPVQVDDDTIGLLNRLRELKLLDDTVKAKVQHLKRLNSDVRLQSKVVEDQLYLASIGRGPKTGLKARIENGGGSSVESETSSSAAGDDGEVQEDFGDLLDS